jgi:hypothetical protein
MDDSGVDIPLLEQNLAEQVLRGGALRIESHCLLEGGASCFQVSSLHGSTAALVCRGTASACRSLRRRCDSANYGDSDKAERKSREMHRSWQSRAKAQKRKPRLSF